MAQQPLPRGIERLTDLPIALAVRFVGALIGRIGPRGAYRFARLLGSAWYGLFAGRRRIALRNLEIAFRDGLSPARRSRICKASFAHTMATAVDVFLRERAIPPEGWARSIAADGATEELIARPHPRGLAVLSAHIGDWEMVHYFLALRGLPVAAVARAIHNPHLDRLATRLRTRRGASVIPKAGALREVARIIRAGGAAGLMTDQSAPPGESFQKFFGASASTYFQYARLLARSRPDAAFLACIREGFSFRFRIVTRDLSGILQGPGDSDERARALVEAYLGVLEEVIRAHPEQYLWMHRRWKLRPPGAPDLYGRPGEPLDPGLLDPGSPGGGQA